MSLEGGEDGGRGGGGSCCLCQSCYLLLDTVNGGLISPFKKEMENFIQAQLRIKTQKQNRISESFENFAPIRSQGVVI